MNALVRKEAGEETMAVLPIIHLLRNGITTTEAKIAHEVRDFKAGIRQEVFY
jgi:hypothetical protein